MVFSYGEKAETIVFTVMEAEGVYKMQRIFTAVVHREDDWFVAECPEVGTVSQGTTIEESIENLKEATELYLEEAGISIFERSVITTFEASVNV